MVLVGFCCFGTAYLIQLLIGFHGDLIGVNQFNAFYFWEQVFVMFNLCGIWRPLVIVYLILFLCFTEGESHILIFALSTDLKVSIQTKK